MSAEQPEGMQVTATLSLLTWYRIITAARHGEQEVARLLRENQYPEENVPGMENARHRWLEALDELADQIEGETFGG